MSYIDPCSNCGDNRASCDCGNWNGYKKKRLEETKNLCSCGRGKKLDGEYYCKECLKENPLLCA